MRRWDEAPTAARACGVNISGVREPGPAGCEAGDAWYVVRRLNFTTAYSTGVVARLTGPSKSGKGFPRSVKVAMRLRVVEERGYPKLFDPGRQTPLFRVHGSCYTQTNVCWLRGNAMDAVMELFDVTPKSMRRS